VVVVAVLRSFLADGIWLLGYFFGNYTLPFARAYPPKPFCLTGQLDREWRMCRELREVLSMKIHGLCPYPFPSHRGQHDSFSACLCG